MSWPRCGWSAACLAEVDEELLRGDRRDPGVRGRTLQFTDEARGVASAGENHHCLTSAGQTDVHDPALLLDRAGGEAMRHQPFVGAIDNDPWPFLALDPVDRRQDHSVGVCVARKLLRSQVSKVRASG